MTMTDNELAGWARNWDWNDCADDRPVDPSIYFRDMRMLKAFIEHCRRATPPALPAGEEPALAKLLREVDPKLADVLTDNAAYVRMIRKNVIEECAQLCDRLKSFDPRSEKDYGGAIRALSPSSNGKPATENEG